MSHRNVLPLTARREDAEAEAAAAARTAFTEQRLTIAEAAADAHVSVNTLRRAYVYGHLVVQRFGMGARRSIRVRRGDLMAWLAAGGQTGPK